MHQHIHIPVITAIMVAMFTGAVVFLSIRAYLDANRCLQWHERKHKTFPWITTAPTPSAFQRIMNSILFIKTNRK